MMTIVGSNANYYSSGYGMMQDDFSFAAGHDYWVCTDHSLQWSLADIHWATAEQSIEPSVLP